MKTWFDLKAVVGTTLLLIGIVRLIYISFSHLDYVSATLLNLTIFFASAYLFYSSWTGKGGLLTDLLILGSVPLAIYESGRNPHEVFNILMFSIFIVPILYFGGHVGNLIRVRLYRSFRD